MSHIIEQQENETSHFYCLSQLRYLPEYNNSRKKIAYRANSTADYYPRDTMRKRGHCCRRRVSGCLDVLSVGHTPVCV